MIKLNDINETVIDEKKIIAYGVFVDNYYEDGQSLKKESIELLFLYNGMMIHYDTKEARDKDIELLDKLFSVKNLEDMVEKPADKEEYLTWCYVVQSDNPIKAKFPNGEIRKVYYNSIYDNIAILSGICEDITVSTINNEALFNALMLKRVEL